MTSRRFWIATVLATAAWIAAIAALEANSPRLIASWHGFLHAGIATRFPSPTFAPENPFFAGEPVAYYWVYQWMGGLLGRVSGLDVLHAFRWIAWGSLATLVIAAAWTGRDLYRSTIAGLTIGYLALVGMNPAGPAIAATKYLVLHQSLWTEIRSDTGGDEFVTNAQADDRMVKPLLGALNIGTDWRMSQDVVWFFDVSSRAPAIALLMVMAWLLTRPPGRWPTWALMGVGAAMTALNPIIGLASAVAVFVASIVVRRAGSDDSSDVVVRSAAFLTGALVAVPTFAHLFGFNSPAVLTLDRWFLIKSASLAAGFALLLPLAWASWKRGAPESRLVIGTLSLASVLLVIGVPFVGLAEGNQHNLVNAASCLLAVPAAGWVAGRGERGAASRALWIFLACLPATIAVGLAFADRPDLPLRAEGRELHRLPIGGPLDAFYHWVRVATPANAVLVCDPDRPAKMSGNVSEIPAFTSRALFVDHPSYMTAPYPDRDVRMTLARELSSGQAPSDWQRAYLGQLKRPIYVVTFAGDDRAVRARLETAFGAPAFEQGFVAAFLLSRR